MLQRMPSPEAGHASQATQIARGAAKRAASGAVDEESHQLSKFGGSGSNTKNSMRDLLGNMNRFGYAVKVPIRYVTTVYHKQGEVRHPVLSLMDMLDFMINQGHSALLLGGHSLDDMSGNWRMVLRQYWQRYALHDPLHIVLTQNEPHEREFIVPLMVYGDEGTGKRKMPVWLFCWKPVLFAATDSYRRTFMVTCVAHSLYSGFHSGMAGSNACLEPLIANFVGEAQRAYATGSWTTLQKSCYVFTRAKLRSRFSVRVGLNVSDKI